MVSAGKLYAARVAKARARGLTREQAHNRAASLCPPRPATIGAWSTREIDAYRERCEALAAMDAARRAIVNAAPTLCPHCGTAPANADGHACDYCRGYAYR